MTTELIKQPKEDVAVAGHVSLIEDHSPYSFLVTGAAGSIGTGFIKQLCETYPDARIRAMDKDEYGLFKLQQECPSPKVEPFLGDVKDPDQVSLALEDMSVVVHTAAIKRIEIAEHNPIESIKTNVMGTANFITEIARLRYAAPRQFLLISSDKALPSNDMLSLYGSTKLQQEYLTLWAHRMYQRYCQFSIARFGNVIDSRGNVFEIWEDYRKRGVPLPVTDTKMKRFFWWNRDAARFILKCLQYMDGGEIFIPNIPEMQSILEFIDTKKEIFEVVGLRPGETITQRLLSPREEVVAHYHAWCIKILVDELDSKPAPADDAESKPNEVD